MHRFSFFLWTIPASSESVCAVIAIITYQLVAKPALVESHSKLLCRICLCVVKGRLTKSVRPAACAPRKSSHTPTDQRYSHSVLLLAADRTLSIKAQSFRIHSDMLVELFHLTPPFHSFSVCNFFRAPREGYGIPLPYASLKIIRVLSGFCTPRFGGFRKNPPV